MSRSLTPEQLQQLTVEMPQDSPVLCLICAANAGVQFHGLQVDPTHFEALKQCVVIPAERWRCPKCNTNIREGRGKGKCPCCGQPCWAKRSRWTYVADCACIETEEQRKATAEADEARRRYYDREERPTREREEAQRAKAEANADAAIKRAKASECLDEMPERTCTEPAGHLPYDECRFCPRFDKKAPPGQVNRKGNLQGVQPSTPLRDRETDSWQAKPGWKDRVQMKEFSLSDADLRIIDGL